MLKRILIAVALIIVVFAIVVATRPADFRVTRSASISAPPEAVFPHVNDLHRWEAWSPWAKLDPEMKQTYSGPESGVGAGYAIKRPMVCRPTCRATSGCSARVLKGARRCRGSTRLENCFGLR